MFARTTVIILLLLLRHALSLDPNCISTPDLVDWNDKVDQIKLAVDNKAARGVPLCIGMTANTIMPQKHMNTYLPVFDDIANKVKNGQAEDLLGVTTEESGRSPQGYVKTISFSRITVPERSMTNLRQWVHIQFNVDSLVGLIVQPICTPLGLPCGQFKLSPDIMCADCPHMQYDAMFQAPCLYRPLANVMHPHAWVYKGTVPRNDLHTNFIWIDAMCQEMLSLQFLIVAVKDFTNIDYEIFYSPVYGNEHQDSKEGSPYPWVKAPFFRKTLCHGGEQTCPGCHPSDPIKLGVSKATGVILPYNEDYHQCSTTKAWDGQDNECPPGPFKCYTNRAETATMMRAKGIILGDTLEEYRENMVPHMMGCPGKCKDPDEQREEACSEFLLHTTTTKKPQPIIVAPLNKPGPNPIPKITTKPTTVPGTKPPPINTNETSEEMSLERKSALKIYDTVLTSSVLLGRAENRIHGTLMVFAWFVLTLCSIFVSRFLKESAGISGSGSYLGMGWWLWCHILLSFLTLGVIWMGVSGVAFRKFEKEFSCDGLLQHIEEKNLTGSEDKELDSELRNFCKSRNVHLFHSLAGSVTIVILYIQLITGFVRPMTQNLRVCNIAVHALLGYLVVVLASSAAFLSTACYEIKLLIFGIILLNLILIFVGTFFQMFLDSRANRDRAACPVPEVKEIGPCGVIKASLTFFQCVSTLILYYLITYSYSHQQGLQDGYLDKALFSGTAFSSDGCPSFGAGIAARAIISEVWD